jgi:hypothetical protein
MESMILEHYSRTPINSIRSEIPGGRWDNMKPKGLWVSVKGEDDWPSWCKGEDWGDIGAKLCYRIELHENAKLLMITNGAELIDFHEKYSAQVHEKLDFFRVPDWARVGEKYQGIIIAPYIWSMRLHSTMTWYYGWDCASGAIWDATAIANFYEVENEYRLANKETQDSQAFVSDAEASSYSTSD